MSSITKLDYFVGEFKLPNTTGETESVLYQNIIDSNENLFLEAIFGISFTQYLYEANAAPTTYNPDYVALVLNDAPFPYVDTNGDTQVIRGIVRAITAYMYYKILEYGLVQVTANGVIATKHENNIVADPKQEQARAWNVMVDELIKVHNFLDYQYEVDKEQNPNELPINLKYGQYYGLNNHPTCKGGTNYHYFKKINVFGI